jgi:hypothetical protein
MAALRTLEILIASRIPFIAIEALTRTEDIDALCEWEQGRTAPAS